MSAGAARRPRGRTAIARLEDLPNVGPSIARDLRRLGIRRPGDLRGRDPWRLYRRLCVVSGQRQDPCVLDVFISLARSLDGGPARPWWAYTAERKRRASLDGAPRQP